MSNKLRRPIWRRAMLPLFTLVAAALLATAGAAPRTSARIQEHDIYYFTDATLTTQCGWKVYTCYGTVKQSGCVTPYTFDEWYDC